MRLIDADALKATRKIRIDRYTGEWPCLLMADIKNAPTIDAVPVVRCKDCKHWGEPYCMLCKTRIGTSYHSRDMAYRKSDDFCSYGERKDGDCNA